MIKIIMGSGCSSSSNSNDKDHEDSFFKPATIKLQIESLFMITIIITMILDEKQL